MSFTLPAALCALAVLTTSSVQAAAPPSVEAQLRAEDERLLAAVHAGGRAEWARATAPDLSYIEAGNASPARPSSPGPSRTAARCCASAPTRSP